MKYRYEKSIIFSLIVLVIGSICSFLLNFSLGAYIGKEISIGLGFTIASGFAYSDSMKELFGLFKIKDD